MSSHDESEDSPSGQHSDVTHFTVEERSTTGGGGARPAADVSQFVRYLLEGSGVPEQSVDYAALRQELESVEGESVASAAAATQTATEPKTSTVRLPSEFEGTPAPAALDGDEDDTDSLYQRSQPMLNRPTYRESAPAPAATLAQEEPSALQKLSRGLALVGLPELSGEFVELGAPRSTGSLTTVQRLAELLIEILTVSIVKHRENAVLVDELTSAASAAASSTARVPMKPVQDSSTLELRDQVSTMRSTVRSLTDALRQSTAEAERLRTTVANQSGLVESYQADMDQLRRKLVDARQLEEERRERARDMIEAIRAVRGEKPVQWSMKRPAGFNEGKAAEAMVLDIAEVYEEKVRDLEMELAAVARKLGDGRAAAAVVTRAGQDDVDVDDVMIVEPGTRTSAVQVEMDRNADIQMAPRSSLVKENEELRKQLEALTDAYEELQEEKDLVELKLLSNQPGSEIINRPPRTAKNMTTNELIQRDKIHHRLRLKQIESMSNDDCKAILKSVCIKLNVDKLERLEAQLDDVSKAVRLIPQMQTYIKTVDTIVWSPPRILAEFLSHDIPHSSNPHKLADTLVTLESWRRVVEKYHHPAARDTADEEEQEQEPATQAHIRGLSTSPPPQRLQVVDTRETTMMSLDNILGRVSEDERRWEKQYKSDTAEDNIPE